MRASRALLASLGAGTALILAGTVALAAFSTIVAFQGWPGLRSTGGGGQQTALVLAADTEGRPATTSDEPIVVAPRRAPARRPTARGGAAVGRGAVGRVPASAPVASRQEGQTASAAGPGPTGGYVPSPATPGASTSTQPQVRLPRAGDTARRVTDGVGTGVQGTGAALQQQLKPASPTLADTVAAVTDGVGQTVKDVGTTVGGVVDALAGTR